MAGKEDLKRITPRDLFGPNGPLVFEGSGAQNYLRVASGIHYVRERAKEKGLEVSCAWIDKNWGTFYVIYEEGKLGGKSFALQNPLGDREGVWVADVDLDRYQELIGIQESITE